MKPVLISPNKAIGYKWQALIFIAVSILFLWAGKVFSLYQLIPQKIKNYNDSLYPEYVAVLLISLITAYILSYVIKVIKKNNEKKIVFSINLALDGSYHYVKAPAEISSSEFLSLFYQYLSKNKAKEKYSKVLDHYFPFLEIRRNDELIRFGGEDSLMAGGLRDGDICQIVGKPKKND